MYLCNIKLPISVTLPPLKINFYTSNHMKHTNKTVFRNRVLLLGQDCIKQGTSVSKQVTGGSNTYFSTVVQTVKFPITAPKKSRMADKLW